MGIFFAEIFTFFIFIYSLLLCHRATVCWIFESLQIDLQCALHWKKCECLVEFDRAFLSGQWKDCEKWLLVMVALAPEEADFRWVMCLFTCFIPPTFIFLRITSLKICTP